MWKRRDLARERSGQLLGSRGAASAVRRIDPATYQPTEPARPSRAPRRSKAVALLDEAGASLQS